MSPKFWQDTKCYIYYIYIQHIKIHVKIINNKVELIRKPNNLLFYMPNDAIDIKYSFSHFIKFKFQLHAELKKIAAFSYESVK